MTRYRPVLLTFFAGCALFGGCAIEAGDPLVVDGLEAQPACVQLREGSFLVLTLRLYNRSAETIELASVESSSGPLTDVMVGIAALPRTVSPTSAAGWVVMYPIDTVVLSPESAGYELLLVAGAESIGADSGRVLLRYHQANREFEVQLPLQPARSDGSRRCAR